MQIPFTLRFAYHSFRAIIRAGLLFICAWVLLIPANATEISALGASQDTQYPYGLRMMRTAKVIVTIAPDRAYDVIAMVAGAEISPLLVRVAFIQMAAGRVLPAGASREPMQQNDRDIDGPRFIQID